MKTKCDFYWDLNELPFIWTELSTPKNGNDMPDTLPFKLYVDNTTGVLTQEPNTYVEDCLTKAYEIGSVFAGVMEENSAYADDFIDFFKISLEDKDLSKLRVLEIGSGTGYLLSLIKALGADVIGIEPGVHGSDAYNKYDVEIVNGFFPSDKIYGKFDIIIMTGVLEHIQSPSHFLKTLHPYLEKNGLFFATVPDVESFLNAGDISPLFHEHYSYFTETTLDNTFKVGGFKAMVKQKSTYGAMLFFTGVLSETQVITTKEVLMGCSIAIDYKNKAINNIRQLKLFFNNIQNDGKKLGIYVPSRLINFLSISALEFSNMRFFDDNPSIKGKYYPGIDISIEIKDNLIESPTDIVLIFSSTFGEKIKDSLVGNLPEETKIITWNELFTGFLKENYA